MKKMQKNDQQEETKKINEELTIKIKELETALVECDGKWRRALADYQNLEKRTQSEKFEFAKYAAKNFLIKLLPVFDDLEKAQKHLKDEGLQLLIKKLEGILYQEGIAKIETKDKEYAIETMEAIQIVKGEKDNHVVEEVRSGYLMHGSVIRPAQVIVSKKSDE